MKLLKIFGFIAAALAALLPIIQQHFPTEQPVVKQFVKKEEILQSTDDGTN